MYHTLFRHSKKSPVVVLLTVFVFLALTVAASAAGPTPPDQAVPTGSNAGGPASPALMTPERALPAEVLAPMAVTGITDPAQITPSTVYNFSGDAEFSSPTTFPGGAFSGTGEVRITGSSWGSWNPDVAGIHVLFATTGSYEIIFNELQTGVGVVAEPNNFATYNVTIKAFNMGGASLGSFTRAIAGKAGAAFLGVLSDTTNIKRVVLSSEATAGGFAFTDLTYGGPSIVLPMGPIFGWLFIDENLNAWRDVGEDEGVPNRQVLLLQDGVVVQTTYTTLPRGWYQLDNVAAGDYCVRMAIPEGYAATTPAETCFTFDGTRLNVNFGVTQAQAIIGDVVYEDKNGNGLKDLDETGFQGVTVALWSAVDGQPGEVIATTTTDGWGVYRFMVNPGTYFVQVTDENQVLAGLTLTAGANPAGPITVGLAESYLEADFGYSFVCPANRSVLSGRVWIDENGDRVWSGGDQPVRGVEVCAQPMSQIYAARCVTTDTDGIYRMCVRPMTYLVAPEVEEGSPIYGLMPLDRAFRLPVAVKPGMQLTDINFGFVREMPVQ